MKKLLLASVAVVAVVAAGPAGAADLPRGPVYKALPPVVAPVPYFTWTGCYLGGHVGPAWGRKKWSDNTPEFTGPTIFFIGGFVDNNSSSVSHDIKGWLGGGQVGCDYQISPRWVIGIEGSGSAADIEGSVHADPFFTNKVFKARTDWLASLTGRVGFTLMPTLLLYARGGAAWAGDKYSAYDFRDVQPFTAPSETRSGFTVGGGIEWAFSPGWSAFVEYDFYDFGSRLVNFLRVGDPLALPNANIKQEISAVKFGINWRFGGVGKGKAPVVAKY